MYYNGFNPYTNTLYSQNPVNPNFTQDSIYTMRQLQMPATQSPQTQMAATPNDERIWVQGRAAAEAYLVVPNGFARLWDTNGKCFYEKSADASGRPSMKVFTYFEEGNEPTVTQSVEQKIQNEFKVQPSRNLEEEVTSLEKRIEALEERKKA